MYLGPARRVLGMTSALRPRGSTRQWRRIRAAIIERDGAICQICGGSGAKTVDHIVRRIDGGTDTPANLRAAHHSCSFVERVGVRTSRQW